MRARVPRSGVICSPMSLGLESYGSPMSLGVELYAVLGLCVPRCVVICGATSLGVVCETQKTQDLGG